MAGWGKAPGRFKHAQSSTDEPTRFDWHLKVNVHHVSSCHTGSWQEFSCLPGEGARGIHARVLVLLRNSHLRGIVCARTCTFMYEGCWAQIACAALQGAALSLWHAHTLMFWWQHCTRDTLVA